MTGKGTALRIKEVDSPEELSNRPSFNLIKVNAIGQTTSQESAVKIQQKWILRNTTNNWSYHSSARFEYN